MERIEADVDRQPHHGRITVVARLVSPYVVVIYSGVTQELTCKGYWKAARVVGHADLNPHHSIAIMT